MRPVGRESVVLERPSQVEVYVNGALVQTLQAQAGPLDIRDIPATSVSNDVSIVVVDDLGRREIDSFSIGNDVSLLGAGLAEFSLSAGVLRSFTSAGFHYSGDPVFNAYVTRGLSDDLTVGGHLIVAQSYQNGGGSAAFSILDGVALVEGAVSNSDGSGSGVAVGFTYRGDPILHGARGGMLNLRADYQSENFQTLSSFGVTGGVEYDIAADYRFQMSERTSVSFGGSLNKRYGSADMDVSAFAGVQQRFGQINAGATLRYLNLDGRPAETGVFVTLSRPVGNRTFASANYDTTTQRGRIDVRKLRSLELPQVEYAVRAQTSPTETEYSGNFTYGTSRFETSADVSRLYIPGGTEGPLNSRVKLQSGFAYVDGHFGIGKDPSLGFTVISRHPSLSDSKLAVRTGAVGRQLGVADRFGPAVAPVFTPFAPQELTVDAINAPIGYDIGPGTYVVQPAGRSGMSIVVGGDAYRVAIGHLVRPDGSAFSLTTGQLTDLATGESTTFFTNRTGRAAFNKLAPGQYEGRMDNTDFVFRFEITDSDNALIQLGDIVLEARQ